MTLTEICHKYKISDSFLGSKEDGLVVAAVSLDDIIRDMQTNNENEEIVEKLKKLSGFLREVKNSSF